MPIYKKKKLTDVHRAIELIKFPLYKVEGLPYYKAENIIEIKDWKEVFNTFGLEYMQKNIIIDMHPFYTSYDTYINLLMGTVEDVSLYKLTEDWKKFDFEEIDQRNANVAYMKIEYVKRKKGNKDAK